MKKLDGKSQPITLKKLKENLENFLTKNEHHSGEYDNTILNAKLGDFLDLVKEKDASLYNTVENFIENNISNIVHKNISAAQEPSDNDTHMFIESKPLDYFTPDEVVQIKKIINGEQQLNDNNALWNKLYKFYQSAMPYGTAKARTGDPDEFIFQRIEKDFK